MKIFFFLILTTGLLRGQVLLESLLLLSPPAAPTYTYTATEFTSGDYIVHSGDFTGAADSKQLTISIWFKLNSASTDGVLRYIYRHGGDMIVVYLDTDNTMVISTQDPTFSFVIRARTTSTFTASSSWRHLLFSADAEFSSNRYLYIDGSDDSPTWTHYVNANIDFTNGGDVAVGATAAGSNPPLCSLSEVYLNQGAWLDFSVAGNRQLFRSAGGKPVNLGGDGSTPTGGQPELYLKNSFATFQNNLGGGGNFTVTGTLSDDASIP